MTFAVIVGRLWKGLGTLLKGRFGNVQNAETGPLPYTSPINFSIATEWTGYNMPPKPHYFTEAEVEGLDSELVAKLDWARGRAQVPFIITSGKRSPAENERVMGVDASAHIKGLAVDLRCADSPTRYRMLQALILAGFKRIGIYDKHLHVDLDESLPQEVAWVGVSH